MAYHDAPAIKHGDIRCEYNERTNIWSADVENAHVTAPTLAELRKKLDRILKGTFKRVPGLLYTGWHDRKFEDCVVTSKDDRNCYWIMQGKSRSKVNASEVYADTSANRKEAAKVMEMQKQLEILEEKKRTTLDRMARINVDKVES